MDNIFNEERFEKGGVVLERLHPELAVKPFIPYYEKMGYTVTIIEKPNGWVEIIGEKKFEEGGEISKSIGGIGNVKKIFVKGEYPNGNEFYKTQFSKNPDKVINDWMKDNRGLDSYTIIAKLNDGEEIEIQEYRNGGYYAEGGIIYTDEITSQSWWGNIYWRVVEKDNPYDGGKHYAVERKDDSNNNWKEWMTYCDKIKAINSIKREIERDKKRQERYKNRRYEEGGEIIEDDAINYKLDIKQEYDVEIDYSPMSDYNDEEIVWRFDIEGDTNDLEEINDRFFDGEGSVWRNNLSVEKVFYYAKGGEVQKSKLQEMFEVQQRGSMREKAEFLKNNPEIFMGKVFEEGGITEVNEDGSNLPQELYILFAEMDLDREGSYDYMEELRVEANEMGYDFDYDLSGTLTHFWKLDDKYDKGGEVYDTIEETKETFKLSDEEWEDMTKDEQNRYRKESLETIKRGKKIVEEHKEKGKSKIDIYPFNHFYAKGGRTKIVNEGVVFDSKKYKGILGDRDKDGVPNADDSEPNNPKIKKQVEQVKISKVFENLLDEKDSSDLNMNNLVNEMEITLPNKYGIYARTKTPFSIIKKLVEKRLRGKKGLTDMIGTTITVNNNDELQEVSRMLGGSEGANGKFGLVLDYDDFFSNPNCGYQAYHYIVNYNGEPIEIQLKTKRMKQLNEISHEFYKEGNLDCDGMEKMANLVNDADNGNKEAQKEFSYLMNNINELANIISTGSKEMGGRTDWINTINNSKESANIYRFY